MKLGRLHADRERGRDLLRRLSFSDQLQHLPLPRRQMGDTIVLLRRASVYNCLRRTGRHVQPPLHDLGDRLYEIISALTLLDEPLHAGFERLAPDWRISPT